MKRLEAVRKIFGSEEEAALICTPYNRRYFTGFASSAGYLVITREAADLIIDFRYIEAARAGVNEDVSVLLQVQAFDQIREILDSAGVKKVYLEQELTLSDYELMRSKLPYEMDTGDALTGAAREARSVKDAGELQAMRESQAITDAAFSAILGYIRPGLTEVEIAARLEYEMRIRGSEGQAFSTICVSGENTSRPHGVPGDRVIRSGDFITMDFGSTKHGYLSDMTRTVAVGNVSEKQKLVYETVLQAHLESMHAAKAGVTGAELDGIARKIIDGAGFQGKFGHGLGHSVGLEIHEPPFANARNDRPIPAGTIMTIEPGIYLEGEFGVRIENMICITEDGFEDIPASPRELIIL